MLKRGRGWKAAAWVVVGVLALGGLSSAQAQTRSTPKKASTSESAPKSSKTVDSDKSDAPERKSAQVESGSSWHGPGRLLDRSEQRRAHQIAVMLNIPWWFWGTFPLSFSVRYHLPILHNGFIPAVNDWFGLELGSDFSVWFGGNRLRGYGNVFMWSLPVEAFWAVRLLPTLAAYVKAGVGFEFIFYPSLGIRGYSGFHFSAHPIFQHGIIWNFAERFNLRAEIGYPYLLSVGVGFHLF
ncbi:MAG: porin family protein [Cystobacterineae bacterium]|nr:porin family protein [Cystobacterineae bacterium]